MLLVLRTGFLVGSWLDFSSNDSSRRCRRRLAHQRLTYCNSITYGNAGVGGIARTNDYSQTNSDTGTNDHSDANRNSRTEHPGISTPPADLVREEA
jgi:hypothetical protein